ncbi:MAG: SIMPL domain-containing protein [Tepidisphaeraceae bacterium]|jgi:uncharacterized protein YggE
MKEAASEFSSGVRVFGSSIIRVSPDTATISVAVSRLEKDPKKAFGAARQAAAAVQSYLSKQNLDGFGSSRITLLQEHQFIQSERRLIGYRAKIGYSITLRDLDRIEIVAGVGK